MAELRELPLTRLVLIRDARKIYHDPVRLVDHDDLGISEEGRAQAEKLRDRLTATGELAGTTRLLCSSARRTMDTARVISSAIGGLEPEPSCGFCEPHNGECDGMPVAEWQATLAKERMANWSPYAPKSPGGESYRTAIERAAKAYVETILDNAGGTVVVVTQTVPLRASLWAFLSLPFHGSYFYPEITDTGITEWVTDGWLPESGQMRARLVRYNDAAHLLPRAWTAGEASDRATGVPNGRTD